MLSKDDNRNMSIYSYTHFFSLLSSHPTSLLAALVGRGRELCLCELSHVLNTSISNMPKTLYFADMPGALLYFCSQRLLRRGDGHLQHGEMLLMPASLRPILQRCSGVCGIVRNEAGSIVSTGAKGCDLAQDECISPLSYFLNMLFLFENRPLRFD